MKAPDWELSFSWNMDVPAGTSDAVILGPVWGPGSVERVTFLQTVQPILYRAWAVPGRLPIEQAVAIAGPLVGDVLFAGASDTTSSLPYWDGIIIRTTEPVTVALRRQVPWGPWWFLLKMHNFTAGGADLSGFVGVRVVDEYSYEGLVAVKRVVAPHLVRSASRDRGSLVR